MTKKEFKKKAMRLFVEKKDYKRLLDKALASGAIDLETLPDNYLAVYPVAAAIYRELTKWYLTGSNDTKTRRQQKKEAEKIYAYI